MNDIKITDRRRKPGVESTVPAAIVDPPVKPPKKTVGEMADECPIEPTPGRYIFVTDEFEYKGKMIIPETAKRRGTTGMIIKSNPIEGEPVIFHPGHRVLIGRYSGTLIEFNGKPSYHIIQDAEILAWVLTDDQLVDQTVG